MMCRSELHYVCQRADLIMVNKHNISESFISFRIDEREKRHRGMGYVRGHIRILNMLIRLSNRSMGIISAHSGKFGCKKKRDRSISI